MLVHTLQESKRCYILYQNVSRWLEKGDYIITTLSVNKGWNLFYGFNQLTATYLIKLRTNAYSNNNHP